jgi:hypothetical protein
MMQYVMVQGVISHHHQTCANFDFELLNHRWRLKNSRTQILNEISTFSCSNQHSLAVDACNPRGRGIDHSKMNGFFTKRDLDGQPRRLERKNPSPPLTRVEQRNVARPTFLCIDLA